MAAWRSGKIFSSVSAYRCTDKAVMDFFSYEKCKSHEQVVDLITQEQSEKVDNEISKIINYINTNSRIIKIFTVTSKFNNYIQLNHIDESTNEIHDTCIIVIGIVKFEIGNLEEDFPVYIIHNDTIEFDDTLVDSGSILFRSFTFTRYDAIKYALTMLGCSEISNSLPSIPDEFYHINGVVKIVNCPKCGHKNPWYRTHCCSCNGNNEGDVMRQIGNEMGISEIRNINVNNWSKKEKADYLYEQGLMDKHQHQRIKQQKEVNDAWVVPVIIIGSIAFTTMTTGFLGFVSSAGFFLIIHIFFKK